MVSRSSAEAEFRSIAATLAEVSWLKSLLSEHISYLAPPTVFCDNLSVVLLTTNPILHNRTKHYELDLYFVRDQVNQKKVFVVHIPSYSEQIADILTKPLSLNSFDWFKLKLRVSSSSPLSLLGDDRHSVNSVTSVTKGCG